jgi:hypothetical protein
VDGGSSSKGLSSQVGCSWVMVMGFVEGGATVAAFGRRLLLGFVVLGFVVLGVCVAGAFAVGLFVVEALRRRLVVVPFEAGLLLERRLKGTGKGAELVVFMLLLLLLFDERELPSTLLPLFNREEILAHEDEGTCNRHTDAIKESTRNWGSGTMVVY